ncbi:MAG: fructosamine kinase family protein [Sulfuricaulis sp.]|uniref:fructosamine kinase family protein n=1 Tax=Sulfuricaulis sp. TaxID=2003553 RepID=UPI0025FFADF8|nr:fructosamine kinase family protein [Sulfuricaulis sp.]MCR4346297.1 fructosamine kinase family protein [Sulfuricaulis sp.]
MESAWVTIAQHISAATGAPFAVRSQHSVGGGCINSATVLQDTSRKFFVKLNDAARLSMFEAEAEGLKEIAQTRSVRVPRPICSGEVEDSAFLVLEHLELEGADARGLEQLGRELAQMHRSTQKRFGWHLDNTIGSTPQINTPGADWVEFWREHRLGFQLELATQNGRNMMKKGERLMANMEKFFHSYHPAPSLLHGDLWGGNVSATGEQPVIFDPAVYYGDREADLAMTELFGGFPARFYQSYQEAWPLDPGYKIRKTLYNLYHVLNHLNLFGGGYASQAEHMIDSLLSELR